MASLLQRISNSIQSYNPFFSGASQALKQRNEKNLSTYISPVQLQRLRHDVQMWREAVIEAENAWYPHRVRMQRLMIDTSLNGHVAACVERRKDLTLLRDFCILDADGNENEDLKKFFTKKWFNDLISYSLDSIFYGYSLVSLGDITDGDFKDLSIVRRWNISPDRLNVTSLVYSLSGQQFLDEPFKDWHVWVPTSTETGQSPCGYGLLYKVAVYEIFLRNILGYNGDFVELFAQPFRVGKTTKTEENERAEFASVLENIGSSAWAMMDPMDEIQFIEGGNNAGGYASYDNLEQRCQKYISKILLGHADALDSVPGKLGGGSGEENPVFQALEDKQTKDGRFIENVVNNELFPKLRALGFNLPDGIVFTFSNDAEKQEICNQKVVYNKQVADIALTLKNAGMKMDVKYFTEQTGIPVEAIPQMQPNPTISNNLKAKLNNIYK